MNRVFVSRSYVSKLQSERRLHKQEIRQLRDRLAHGHQMYRDQQKLIDNLLAQIEELTPKPAPKKARAKKEVAA